MISLRCALALLLIVAVAPAARAQGADEPTLASLGWPSTTISVEVRRTSHVRSAPQRRAKPVGKIAKGTRALLSGLASGDKRCPFWAEIESRGWLCSRQLQPSMLLPEGRKLPILKKGEVLPGKYYDVREDGAASYKNRKALEASEVSEELSTKTMLRGYGTATIDDVRYLRTNKGYVHPSDLRRLWPSDFGGVELEVDRRLRWPVAFVHTGRRTRAAIVRAAPEPGAAVVERARARTIVEVGQRQGDWVQIGEKKWIRRLNLRLLERQAPPRGIAKNERWIDIDLDEQTLVAYRGAEPVFATLVSTGRVVGKTPTGVYRVRAKAASLRMAEDAQYDVGAVPWTTRFRDGLFLHAAYWHDGFGAKRSHGCVNLSPRDARFVYEFSKPFLPDGWLEVEAELGQGTPIRVRSAQEREPDWYDYADENQGVPLVVGNKSAPPTTP